MRVIAGEARGRPLAGPSGTQTRPTSDKVKGALFSMIETLLAARRPGADVEGGEPGSPDLWQGLTVLDLYAGTGALGIEALSRGAAHCDFVDSHPAARKTIERNLRVTGLADRGQVIGLTAEKVARGSGRDAFQVPYGVVLLDPPYADTEVGNLLGQLATDAFLQPEALVVVEHSRRSALAPTYGSGENVDGALLREVRQRRHGDTVLSIYRYGASNPGKDEHGDGDLSGEL